MAIALAVLEMEQVRDPFRVEKGTIIAALGRRAVRRTSVRIVCSAKQCQATQRNRRADQHVQCRLTSSD